ncbi:MAG: hypothetical protein QM831_06120 [Kofleriaceae bacterium]
MRWVLILGIVGCGDNVPMPVGVVQGSRLFAKGWTFDGASIFTGWHDVKLDIDCRFQVDVNGEFRCFPVTPTYSFADSSCTQPVVVADACSHPSYVTGPTKPLPACSTDTGSTVYAVDGPTADRISYSSSSGHCTPESVPTSSTVFSTHEIESGLFVRATRVQANGVGSLVPLSFVADDGAIEQSSTWNRDRDEECSTHDDVHACMPANTALNLENVSSDDTCSDPHEVAVFYGSLTPCTRPTVSEDVASSPPTFRTLVAPIPGPIYNKASGACEQIAIGPEAVVYSEGEYIPQSSFPVETRTLDGTGQLRATRYEETPGTPLVLASSMFDLGNVRDCAPQTNIDGATRCAPTAAYVSSNLSNDYYFADSACTEPLAQITGEQIILVSSEPAEGSCAPTQYFAHAIGDDYSGRLWGGNGTCGQLGVIDGRWARVGDPIELPILTPL